MPKIALAAVVLLLLVVPTVSAAVSPTPAPTTDASTSRMATLHAPVVIQPVSVP